MGGDHNAVWLNCGIYSAPVANENAVHSMEHGAVWITYPPSLAKDAVDQLTDLVKTENYVVLSPYQNLPSPLVAPKWIPIVPRYSFADTSSWVERVSRAVGAIVPDLVSRPLSVKSSRPRQRNSVSS